MNTDPSQQPSPHTVPYSERGSEPHPIPEFLLSAAPQPSGAVVSPVPQQEIPLQRGEESSHPKRHDHQQKSSHRSTSQQQPLIHAGVDPATQVLQPNQPPVYAQQPVAYGVNHRRDGMPLVEVPLPPPPPILEPVQSPKASMENTLNMEAYDNPPESSRMVTAAIVAIAIITFVFMIMVAAYQPPYVPHSNLAAPPSA